MVKDQLQLDSGMLQFAPKGAYYEEADEQFRRVMDMWTGLFDHDRTLFCLTTLLGGTGFSKGMMSHMLLAHPHASNGKELVPEGLAFDYETKVIMYNLDKERTPRALKNLLMLAGGENQGRVNNNRTRRIILEFIFNRDHDSLDNLAVNYKNKLRTLIRHALGKQDLYKILNGDRRLFRKWIGRYHRNAFPVICYLFDVDLPMDEIYAFFPKVERVLLLKEAAKDLDVETFKNLMKGLPHLTVMGYRNTYKLDIPIGDIMQKSRMTGRQALQMQAAAKRSGAKVKVNYMKQDIYDLWKALYFKLQTGDLDDSEKIIDAIEKQSARKEKIDIGNVTVVIDASKSMQGSDKRPMHPFLTSLSIISILDNIKDVIYVGGKKDDKLGAVIPSGGSDLWRGLVQAVITGAEKILVISDGYENLPKGMFEHVYKHFKDTGYKFELMHINPVFSADANTGSVRKLAEDVKPLPVTNYKYLETEVIFNRMIENSDLVKKLLINKYNKLIGG
jgi:hypothetical protein